MSLLTRASLRYLARHRGQCALAICGIALGIAIVVAIQLTQASARASFADSLASAFGPATHHVIGRDGAFDERHLALVRRLVPDARPSPVVEGSVRLSAHGRGTSLHVLGIDVFSAQGDGAAGFDLRALLQVPGSVVLSATSAARLDLARGARVVVTSNGRRHTLTVLEVLPPRPADGAAALPDAVLLADIATAQELFESHGRLSRIELETNDEHALASLRAALPPALELVPVGRRLRGAENLTRAFYTNLDALSLLALLVGGFMIYNTMSFLAVQRQPLFARLRALGVTRAEIARSVAGEALLLGAAGGVLGIALGLALAARLLAPVTQTLRDHYFDSVAGTLAVTPQLLGGALLLALVVSVAAALWPAWHAAQAAPADAVNLSWRQRAAARGLRRAALAGLIAAVGAGLLLALSSRSLAAGFGALAGLIVAAMLLVPLLVERLLLGAARLAPARALATRLALRSAARALGRIGLAVAALMAATATSIGVGLMVASFRGAVIDWLDQLLRADLYVAQSADGAPQLALDPTLLARLEALPGVAALSLVRRSSADSTHGRLRIAAYHLPPRARAGFRLEDGALPPDFWSAWDTQDLVLVSAPLAYRWRLARGDVLRLNTPHGAIDCLIAGIYTDYGSEQGVVAMSLTRFRHHWQDQGISGAGMYARSGADQRALLRAVERELPDDGTLAAWSNAALKARSLAVFDRTFAVTDVLTVVATLIAALGVFNALLALHLERAREYAVLLALGCAAARLRAVLYVQSAAVGLLALAAAIPLGVLIARLLIDVINLRSFGWRMQLAWDWSALTVPAVAALCAALAATVYPAERAVRIDPANALRHE